MTATYFIALHLYPFTYGDNFILCKKRKKAWNLPICTFDFLGSNLLTKFASASVNALFNDRLENTKKLLAHVIYSLKVVSNIENPLPPNILCFADISARLVKFPEVNLLLCEYGAAVSRKFQMFISYEMASFAL